MHKLFLIFICVVNVKYGNCQQFNLLNKKKTSITLEFTIDTNQVKQFLNNEKTVDFSKKFYCLNQLNKPILPIFNYTFQLSDSTLRYNIQNSEKTKFKINAIRIGEKSKKRGISSSSISTKFDLINLSDPFVYRNFIGQNLQIIPFQFDSLNNELICFNKIQIHIQFEKELNISYDFSIETPTLPLSKKDHFYSFKNFERKLKSINPTKAELLIIHNKSNEYNAIILANWKNQKGIKTNFLKIENNLNPDEIKTKIIDFYSITPNLKYIVILGNQNEIPAYSYGIIDGDNYYSDSYFGQLTNDFFPELFVGRITGTTNEIKSSINKSIYYEKNNFEGEWMNKSIGIASNEGIGEGDNGEADWQHLRNIKTKLTEFGYSDVFEFYDGDHGGSDSPGSPNKSDVIKALNDGVSLLNYTGHGDDNLMLTSQLSSSDVLNLNNNNKNPFVVSVACDNGKFTNDQGTIAESFLKCKDSLNYTGSIAFCGSSILMDWAPPMLTQDEIINSITSKDTLNTVSSVGELFYESQIKMLNKYNSLGNGVMQTWILFGDPSIDLKTKIPENLDISYEYNNLKNELIVTSRHDKVMLGLSKNNQYIESLLLNKGENTIFIDPNNDSLLLTFTKPNYKTFQDTLLKTKTSSNSSTTLFNNIQIYPNPIDFSNSELTIDGLDQCLEIKLIDLLGKELNIETIKKEFGKIIIKSENLKSGMYLLKIFDNKNQGFVKRIIVK